MTQLLISYHHVLQELGKRKLEEVETAALVSEEAIAKRRDRFKSQEDKALQDRKQRFSSADPKAADRKERFKQWLPSGGSSAPGMAKVANAEVAAALGTSLDNSTLSKGRKGKSRVAVPAPQAEKFSEEFKAKAEVRHSACCSFCCFLLPSLASKQSERVHGCALCS